MIPKRKKSWVSLDEASTSMVWPNCLEKKTMLSVWNHVPLAETGRNSQWGSLSATTHQFEPWSARKRTNIEQVYERVILQHDYPCHRSGRHQHDEMGCTTAPHIHRIWLLLIITCSNRWRIAWLSYIRIILKKCKIGWMNSFGLKMHHFIVAVSTLPEMAQIYS